MVRTKTQFVIWLFLVVINGVQFAAALVSNPFIPLKTGQYQLQYANAGVTEPRGLPSPNAPQVAVRHDIYTPFPVIWISLVNLLALTALLLTAKWGDAPRHQAI